MALFRSKLTEVRMPYRTRRRQAISVGKITTCSTMYVVKRRTTIFLQTNKYSCLMYSAGRCIFVGSAAFAPRKRKLAPASHTLTPNDNRNLPASDATYSSRGVTSSYTFGHKETLLEHGDWSDVLILLDVAQSAYKLGGTVEVVKPS